MKATRVFFAGVLGVLLCLGQLRAQTPEETIAAPPAAAPGGDLPAQDSQSPQSLSNWITYNRDNCCLGALGHNPPVGTEFFLRAGPSVPLGGTVFGKALDVGWMIDGGARALIWDTDMNAAWTVETSISNNSNRAGINDVHVPLDILVDRNIIDPKDPTRTRIITVTVHQVFGKGKVPGVTVRGLNRTFVNLGTGREWYMWHSANTPGNNWRMGMDFGGRYGSEKADFDQIRHRTDVIGGVYASLHTDLEIPCGCCIFQCGLRGQWAYTWSDILQKQSDLQDLNLLVNLGVRY